MPAPGVNEHVSAVAEHLDPSDGGAGVDSTGGAGVAVSGGAGVDSAGGAGVAESEGAGVPEPTLHWQRPSTLQGHQVCAPLAQGLHCSSVADCWFPGIASQSLQLSQSKPVDPSDGGTGVDGAGGDGVAESVGAGVDVVVGSGVAESGGAGVVKPEPHWQRPSTLHGHQV